MKKIIIIIILFSSCKKERENLPKSTGLFSEIIFVVEDNLWKNEVEEEVNRIFKKAIIGLNQIEYEYNVIHINFNEFNSLLKTHKNIVIIGNKVKHASQKNKWSENQLVVQINNNNPLRPKLKKIKSIFDLNEINNTRKEISRRSNSNDEKKINHHFEIDIILPNEYTVIQNDSSLFWAIYNPSEKEIIKQILVFSFEKRKSKSLFDQVVKKTDSVFSNNLYGNKKNKHVIIEPLYIPHLDNNIYRGLWKLKNGFMGGPFILKSYIKEDKITISAGVIFSPATTKRNHIKELEAIL